MLGLSLLVGGLFAQGRQAVSPADAPGVRVNLYWVYAEDVTIDGNPASVASPGTTKKLPELWPIYA